MSKKAEYAATQFDYLTQAGALSKEVPAVREAAVPLSCVRVLDSNMMNKVLKATNPAIYKSWEIEDFGDLLKKFRASNILVWERGYAVDEATRHLVSEHLRHNEPRMFARANLAALEVYREWLSRPVDNRSLYVVEEIFHVANLDPQADLPELLKGRLDEYSHWFRDNAQHLSQVENLGMLLQADGELKKLTELVPEMIQMVGQYADNIR